MPEALLRVEGLRTCIDTVQGLSRPVDDVSFEVMAGETHGIVGESGCGKSMTALSIMQLLPEPGGYIENGRILLEGRDLLDLTWSQMGAVRGRDISMIFQEPMTSLNPTLTIGSQLIETGTAHGRPSSASKEAARDLLTRVGLDPAATVRQYAHELSGGMRQRVMIAMALMNRPKLLIADEPTTALDVTVQAQILKLIHELQKEFGMSVMLITHDLAVVAEVCDSVSVMYAGKIVEQARVGDLFGSPKHPYTKDLLSSLPSRQKRGEDLAAIAGTVPDPTAWPSGCRYSDRCLSRLEICSKIVPRRVVDGNSEVHCHLFNPVSAEANR